MLGDKDIFFGGIMKFFLGRRKYIYNDTSFVDSYEFPKEKVYCSIYMSCIVRYSKIKCRVNALDDLSSVSDGFN